MARARHCQVLSCTKGQVLGGKESDRHNMAPEGTSTTDSNANGPDRGRWRPVSVPSPATSPVLHEGQEGYGWGCFHRDLHGDFPRILDRLTGISPESSTDASMETPRDLRGDTPIEICTESLRETHTERPQSPPQTP